MSFSLVTADVKRKLVRDAPASAVLNKEVGNSIRSKT